METKREEWGRIILYESLNAKNPQIHPPPITSPRMWTKKFEHDLEIVRPL